MKKITMADYYNTQAVLQQNNLGNYECNLFVHEYDDILSKFTLEKFIQAVSAMLFEKGRIDMHDAEDYPEINILWEMDTPCRAVFYKIIIEVAGR